MNLGQTIPLWSSWSSCHKDINIGGGGSERDGMGRSYGMSYNMFYT